MDPYAILGLQPFTPKEAIKEQFRKLSKRYHPDITKKNSEKNPVDYVQILEAYKILMDDKKRNETNQKHLQEIVRKNNLKKKKTELPNEVFLLPFERIEYALSLESILENGIRVSKYFNGKTLLDHLGQDILVHVKPLEIKMGAVAQFELPARQVCPVCRGSNSSCYRCRGTGTVKTAEKVSFLIPQSVKDGDLMEFNPMDCNSFSEFTHFRSKKIKIRIVFMNDCDVTRLAGISDLI